MSTDASNIGGLVQPAVVQNTNSWGSLLYGFVKEAGSAAIAKELNEQSPPVNTTQGVTDTAKGEMAANIKQYATPQNIAIGVAGAVGLLIVAFYIAKKL